MTYETPSTQFHCFEIDDGVMGLSFSNSIEASDFASEMRKAILYRNNVTLENLDEDDRRIIDVMLERTSQ
eukprot:TRINITY_DN3835_c0_g1_i1.p1 TRINITY_DN3835_c0_g1~~TRINITY_DN3835_c0_g1_i1.p1  ORF type:complete len:70 (+),score=12.38 TRINITY_DN3835_c0_g1_i1:192-401(+)